jgi:hypothetical protein
MMKQYILSLLPLLLLSACFLRRKEYQATQFTYTRNGQVYSIPLVVPKGFQRQERVDTAGVTLHTFYYPYGAMLYAAYLQDTMIELQPFDKRLHQPRSDYPSAFIYKGQDADERFYREIRQGNLRFGYRLVPRATELLFDSATNYAALQRR